MQKVYSLGGAQLTYYWFCELYFSYGNLNELILIMVVQRRLLFWSSIFANCSFWCQDDPSRFSSREAHHTKKSHECTKHSAIWLSKVRERCWASAWSNIFLGHPWQLKKWPNKVEILHLIKSMRKNMYCTKVQTKVEVASHFFEKLILNRITTSEYQVHFLYTNVLNLLIHITNWMKFSYHEEWKA